MSEVTEDGFTSPQGNGESAFDAFLHEKPVETDTAMNINIVSDDESRSPLKGRRRIKRFSDNGSEVEAYKENVQDMENVLPGEVVSKPSISSDSEDEIFPRKSRLRANSDSSDASPAIDSRIGNKRNRLQEKFKVLLSSRSKVVDEEDTSPKKLSEHENSSSDDSGTGIESFKQKIKKKTLLLKSDICDPDTSSDEGSNQKNRHQKRPKKKSTILMSPKPVRMSAKQAMENMQKIKSESNRMLREKEVSLPYHRPKALSLKDIMSRRKTALSADGKALPVKMNSDQLKQYVKMLEQRNKEMMELCKSDTEEETTDNAVEQNTEPTDTNCKKPTESSVTKESQYEGPDVTLSEKTIEGDLPDLTVEIVIKEQEKSILTEKDDEVMNDVSDHVEALSVPKNVTDDESQLIELHYETEKLDNTEYLKNRLCSLHQSLPEKFTCEENINIYTVENEKASDAKQENYSVLDSEVSLNGKFNSEIENSNETPDENQESAIILVDTGSAVDQNQKETAEEFDDNFSDDFSDGDINMEDLEAIIENAKGVNNTDDGVNSPMLIKDPHNLNTKPRLMGAPGMVIDLDGTNPGSRKLTGVELLKERFSYYSKLKTSEEKERERELKIKPGMQHLKLKQELEDQISEQRSLEWAKRLADEKQQQIEMDAVRGDQSDGDDIDKIEAKLEEKEKCKSSSESEGEEEEEEEICDVKEKPRKRNPMVDDEAEVSGDEEDDVPDDDETEEQNENTEDGNCEMKYDDGEDEDQEDSDESSDASSEEEEDNQSKPRKGRILKAFEDSDDECSPGVNEVAKDATAKPDTNNVSDSQNVKDSQDDLLPLAQTNKSNSEDLFASQASILLPTPYSSIAEDGSKHSDKESLDLGTQTFSILNTNAPEQDSENDLLKIPDQLDVISETQPLHESSLDDIVGMCSGKFTQTQKAFPVESQMSETQCVMGEDVLALCTGKFYDNQFVSQTKSIQNTEICKDNFGIQENVSIKKTEEEKDLFDSILKEVDDEPANEKTQPNKYVFDNAIELQAVSFDDVPQPRKKFVIESDDEGNIDASKPARNNKLKKRKLEKRALQISDDEADEEQSQSEEEEIDYLSEGEDNGVERVVEYDSEENEVEVRPQNQRKKRKMAEFFEQEAELTSEDEWVGSGDEDEAGLDRMEREEGDDDTFHQGKLQRELGQIHMRDVLDQDKREVRLIQELLFEDGDLGEGHRQRKFRWKDLDGEDETGPAPNIIGDSQEEEYESEEQWRKQRHERELFLRNMQKEKETGDPNVSIDRTTIIKANLCSKTMSSLLLEVNGTKIEEATVVATDKKTTKVEQAPFSVFKQSYHGSLLTRGRGALARLAALALPLAGGADDDVATVGPSAKRNFVFAAVSPAAKEPKVNKRKADNDNMGTPRLIKKLKTEDKQISKSSLLDHLRAL